MMGSERLAYWTNVTQREETTTTAVTQPHYTARLCKPTTGTELV